MAKKSALFHAAFQDFLYDSLPSAGEAKSFLKAKSGIHIKPSKKGTFTKASKEHGKSVQGFASQVLANKSNYSSAMVKKANFAKNASHWNHGDAGMEIDTSKIPLPEHGTVTPDTLQYHWPKQNSWDVGSGAVAALSLIDSLIPGDREKRQYVQPQETYNPYQYGTGSQAIMEEGGLITPNGKSTYANQLVGLDAKNGARIITDGGYPQYSGVKQPYPMASAAAGSSLTADKAKEILRDGTAQGHKLTAKQKRYFGWVAGGSKADAGFEFTGDPTKGGKTPAPNLGKPTTADSLALYNNSLAIDNYYNKSGKYQQAKDISVTGNQYQKFLAARVDPTAEFFKGDKQDALVPDPKGFLGSSTKTVPYSQYRKNIDENRFSQRDLAYGILDTRSPMSLYDRRISPTNIKTYVNSNQGDPMAGDVVNIAYYDPIAVKPWNMLTPEERKVRVQKYGNNPNTPPPAPASPPRPLNSSKVLGGTGSTPSANVRPGGFNPVKTNDTGIIYNDIPAGPYDPRKGQSAYKNGNLVGYLDEKGNQVDPSYFGIVDPSKKMKSGGYMEDGGNVQTHWGGDAEQMSDNPYDGGTMQFNGASHDDGGIGMSYNGKGVEVEGGETAVRDADGTLNIMGNMNIPGSKTKFKTLSKKLAKQEQKYTKLKDKGTQLINSHDPDNKFERLKFNSGRLMMQGGDMGQKDIAEKKQTLSAIQTAMLDTADEFGLDPLHLSQGKIKKAKNGAYIKAEAGYYQEGGKAGEVSSYRDTLGNMQEILRSPEKYRKWEVDQAREFMINPTSFYNHIISYNQRSLKMDNKNKDEYLKEIESAKKTINEINNVKYNLDPTSNSFLKEVSNSTPSGLPGNTASALKNLPAPMEKSTKPAKLSQDSGDPTVADRHNNPGNIKWGEWARRHGAVRGEPSKDGGYFAKFPDRTTGAEAMKDLLTTGKSYKNSTVASAIDTWTNHKPYNYNLGTIASKKVSELTPQELDTVMNTMTHGEGTRYGTAPGKINTVPNPGMPSTSPVIPPTRYSMGDLNIPQPQQPNYQDANPPNDLPPLRDNSSYRPIPSNTEDLSPLQVLPELYGFATNRVEPVKAQQYNPELFQPYQVSFQDRRNDNEEATAAAQRSTANNPSAAGNIAAQLYAANNRVSADEFRTNQGITNEVTNKNIELLNDAQMKNLGIRDQQYVRQETAKSKTKAQNQLILNSISSKVLQNNLNNKRLAAYENLYDYRFMDRDNNGIPETATYFGPDAALNFNSSSKSGNTPIPYDPTQTRRVETDAQGNVKKIVNKYPSQLDTQAKELDMQKKQQRLPFVRKLFN